MGCRKGLKTTERAALFFFFEESEEENKNIVKNTYVADVLFYRQYCRQVFLKRTLYVFFKLYILYINTQTYI